MPLYDYQCKACKAIHRDVFYSLADFSEDKRLYCDTCRADTTHELVVRPPAIEDWGYGRYFENLSPLGETFYDKRSYKEYLKKEGLVEWSPKTGMPGSGV